MTTRATIRRFLDAVEARDAAAAAALFAVDATYQWRAGQSVRRTAHRDPNTIG